MAERGTLLISAVESGKLHHSQFIVKVCATIQASLLAGKKSEKLEELLLLDVAPLSLGLGTAVAGPLPCHFLKKDVSLDLEAEKKRKRREMRSEELTCAR